MLGTVSAQLVSLGAAPLLSRLFGPESYGQYGIFVAIMVLISSVSGGRLELAVSMPRQDKTSTIIASTARLLALATTAFIFFLICIIFIVANATPSILSVPLWFFAIPPTALLVAWNGSYAQQNLRALQFSLQAKLRFLQSSIYVLLAILLGLSDITALGLVVATFATQALIFLFHWYRNRQLITSKLKAIAIIRSFRDFPVKQVPATLIETGTSYLPILFIAPQYGNTIAGYFFFAQTVLRQPIAFISNAIGELFRQWLSKRVAFAMSAKKGTIITVSLLSTLSIVIFVPFLLLAPWLVPFVFGSQWSDAAIYFQVFAVISAFQFVASPISPSFYILGHQSWDVILQVITASSLIVYLSLAAYYEISPIMSILVYAAIYVCRYCIQLAMSMRFIMRKPWI